MSTDWSNTPTTTVFTWGNGNLLSDSDGLSYEYFTDQPARDGEPLRQSDILSTGAIIFRNKNLVRNIIRSANNFSEQLTYNFDNDGKIIALNTTVNDTTAFSSAIQYVCK